MFVNNRLGFNSYLEYDGWKHFFASSTESFFHFNLREIRTGNINIHTFFNLIILRDMNGH